MRIRIINARKHTWYDNKLGATFEVDDIVSNGNYQIQDTVNFIKIIDAEIIKKTKSKIDLLDKLPEMNSNIPMPKVKTPRQNKYHREIKPDVWVDIYDVLKAFNVTNPATAHAIKKLLAPGQRGIKSTDQDLLEAIQSIERAREIEQ